MNISSLLNNDDPPRPPSPEPVILAPHLRKHNHNHNHHHQYAPPPPPPDGDHLPLSLQPHLRKRSFSPDPKDRSYRPPSDISSYSRPSSSHSHPHSPTLAHFPSFSPQEPSPLSSFYPRPPLPRPTSSHHSTTPYTFPPVQPSSVRSNSSHSPPVPKPPVFNGLEALVHAATQEQKRMSSLDDRRRSPVIDRGFPSPVSPRRQQQQHHHHHPYQHESEPHFGRDFEYPRRGTGMLVPVDEMQARPPIKRQRLSDADERERPAINGQSSLPMRLSGPGAHAYSVNDKAILGFGIDGAVTEESSSSTSRRTSSGSTSKSVKSREEKSVDRDAGRRKSTSRSRDTEPARQSKPPPLPPPPPPKEQPQPKEQPVAKEQDAHEWLLEHYAENTPPPPPAPAPPPPRVRGPSVSGPSERHHSRTPAPEVATALEQELEDAVGPPSVHKPDTDPDIALELVAESLDADDIKSDRVSMEVDDELLSLVDDPAPAPAPPAPVPTQRYPYAPLPPSLRISKPLTPTIVTVASPAFASPTPVSPFPLTATSERGSMPPPATTHITGKGGAAAKKAESSTTAKAKKATKVRTPCLIVTLPHMYLQPAAKPKPAAKPRAKAATKAKAKPATAAADSGSPVSATASTSKVSKSSPITGSAMKKASAAVVGVSRSRSTSAMAGGSVVPEADGKVEPDEVEEDEDEAKEDDKLYCVCKTRYDEDRVMIACDRCVFLCLGSVFILLRSFFIFDADVMSGIILNALICQTWKWISWINSFVHLASKVCSLRVFHSRILSDRFPP